MGSICCESAFYSFESFALNNVAHELLGEGKLIHEVGPGRGDRAPVPRGQDRSLAAYNLQDCELVSRIFEDTSMMDFATRPHGDDGV